VKLLIVNADDFGLTEGVTRGILEAQQRGIVTSTTLLANGAAFESAVAAARNAPRLGVGVHLNLTQGPAIAPRAEIPNLVDAVGRFHLSPPRLAMGVLLGRVPPAEIECELGAQIEKVSRAGIPITHLDGHKHIHMFPGIAPIVAKLARQFGIPAMRWAAGSAPGEAHRLSQAFRPSDGSRAPAGIALLKQSMKARALDAFAPAFRASIAHEKILTPDHFLGVTQTGFLSEQNLEEILWNLPEGNSELMCHPGYADAELRATGTRLLKQREAELAALTSPKIRRAIETLHIRLANYREMVERLAGDSAEVR